MRGTRIKYALQDASRWLGKRVCKSRGHRYYAGGAYDSNCAYACLRCGELDRPLEGLPATAPDEYGDWPDIDFDPVEEARYECARRWFGALPWPKWL